MSPPGDLAFLFILRPRDLRDRCDRLCSLARPPAMPPTIHLVRHAQGVHNLSIENESIHDPDLTPLGESQCAALRASFPRQRITRLVASPLRRTVNTCLLSFGEPGLLPVVALDSLQEVSDQACDTGSSKEALAAEFGDSLDLSRVSDAWIDKADGPFEPTLEKLSARGLEARRALREIATAAAGDQDVHIVAVSHGGILHFITDDWQGIPEGKATGWANCEARSYQFADPTGQDDDAALVETEESRRRCTSKELTSVEKRQMRAVMQQRMMPFLKIKA
ncbi:hypothetical protein JDV02_004634 [Purpureocillium takamizusanense]|uniref:Phosphoglycerate mutase family protein n=1 Tax=Purpureocillium takamizusanense TaxID=2060973 RepID=A0A9Q8QGD1_9HYPO|nr:uncharacterized protein JDV02_004634 [Purpureocillium takamizusanense]UNI18361.1 hypothetical protein JDV02_004634 [Purpureocillium takamizusanense]